MNTPAEIARLNQAFKALTRHLDHFETVCVKNNSPLRGVYFTNSPDTEFSRVRVAYRRQKANAKR